MPEYLAPGVYVEEINTGPVPIEGVSTSTAGFVGQTVRGPLAPRLVTSFVEFQRWYGGLLDPAVSALPLAMQGFFDNGGQRAFMARVVRNNADAATLDLVDAAGAPALTVRALGPGDAGNRIFVRVRDSTLLRNNAPVGVRITVLYYSVAPPRPLGAPPVPPPAVPPVPPPAPHLVDPTNPNFLGQVARREPSVIEDFDNLVTNPNSPDFLITRIQSGSQLIEVLNANPGPLLTPDETAATPVAAAAGVPASSNGGFLPLTGGDDGDDPTPADFRQYLGMDAAGNIPEATSARRGLAGLEVIDEISLLVVPDEVRFPDVTNAMVDQCERLKDRFAILSVGDRSGTVDLRPPRDSSYAAIYYPFIRVVNPLSLDYPLIPPSGHIAGIYARTDTERGVHKAPANYEVRGMVTRDIDGSRKPLEHIVTKGQHDILNPRGIDVIRDFRSDRRGIRVWGARTMSSDTQWKYVNVRRLFIFVEESIDEGTQWVVFEPNDEPTWARVRRSIGNFLTSVWRSGALMGITAEEAFFVKCDRTTMTQDDIDNGRLICYIGIAPVKPAEFVIFRISQKTIEAEQ